MNQILEYKNENKNYNSENKQNEKKYNIIKRFKIQIYICITILFTSLTIYSVYMYNLSKKEKISKDLMESFNLSALYSNQTNYTIAKTSSNNISSGNSHYVIGLLEIDSINLSYPILSEVTEDLLKISPCRFYGPMPNEVGNLCVAGHNYKNYKFFSNLKNIKINDIIKIQDLNGNKVNYGVYDKYDVNSNDLNCINQETNNRREITLITCNSFDNSKRIVIKARETG